MWDECYCVVVRAFFGIAFVWDWSEDWFFQSCGHCWVFQMSWHIECSTFTASSLSIWKGSTWIPSLPLALSYKCFLRPTWLCIPGCLALDAWSPHHNIWVMKIFYVGEGNDNPLQYSCLDNPMDRGAWWATVRRVAQSQTRLMDYHSYSLCVLLPPLLNIFCFC